MKLSIVVPAYNEGEGVRDARDAIVASMEARMPDWDFEIVFVDDGSDDDTFDHLSDLAATDARVRVLRLVKNYGSHTAIIAGFEHARGDCAAYVACDLQDPPETIPRMEMVLRGPVQIVYAVRRARKDRWTSRMTSRVFFTLAHHLVSPGIPPTGSGMFLLGPKALAAVRLFRERNLTLDGLFATMGYPQARVDYDRVERRHGSSKWTLGKRLRIFADFFVGYSYVPIRFMSYLGISVAALGFLYAMAVVINRLFFSAPIEGWSSLMVVVLLLGGLQMIIMGVMGEYVWRSLDEVRARPRYIIESIIERGRCSAVPVGAGHGSEVPMQGLLGRLEGRETDAEARL
jgi:polyisoprenyl-phosphate glycosyltransferase